MYLHNNCTTLNVWKNRKCLETCETWLNIIVRRRREGEGEKEKEQRMTIRKRNRTRRIRRRKMKATFTCRDIFDGCWPCTTSRTSRGLWHGRLPSTARRSWWSSCRRRSGSGEGSRARWCSHDEFPSAPAPHISPPTAALVTYWQAVVNSRELVTNEKVEYLDKT